MRRLMMGRPRGLSVRRRHARPKHSTVEVPLSAAVGFAGAYITVSGDYVVMTRGSVLFHTSDEVAVACGSKIAPVAVIPLTAWGRAIS